MNNSQKRKQEAFQIRKSAAQANRDMPIVSHPTNGDEDRYPDKIANFSKGLPHDELGVVEAKAYQDLLNALRSGAPAAFEKLHLAGPRKLVNPQAGLAFDLEGPDSHQITMPEPPAFASAEEAAEIGENYWMALARDVHFSDYGSSSLGADAAADLSAFSGFHGPKQNGQVTPDTLFRGTTPGDLMGPYLSQFLLLDIPYGALRIKQKIHTVQPSLDYMTRYEDWLSIQRGASAGPDQFDDTPRYIRNGRDLGQYVHVDALYQAYHCACLILLGAKAPLDAGNPYNSSATQEGFGTFGGPHILSLVTEAATRALKAVWYQKWYVHRRLRPEVFAGRIHNHLSGAANYKIHDDILNSQAVQRIHAQADHTYLLPMAFPEGSPTHPAYGAGHATVAGACTTILKAWFDEDARLADLSNPFPDSSAGKGLVPMVASADGTSLEPYQGSDAAQLTVGGELNKVAANIAIGRNHAGVHWRSDYSASVRLGEQVAIGILRDFRATYNEEFGGFLLTTFDGKKLHV